MDLEKRRKRQREYAKLWRQRNPEKAKAQDRRNYLKRRKIQSEYSRKKYRNELHARLFHSAKKRAIEFNLEFDLTPEDIVIPERCPILSHLELRVGKMGGSDHSPTLDRIIPSKGYVKGNVQVISHLANRIKSNASFEDLILVGEWAKSVLDVQ